IRSLEASAESLWLGESLLLAWEIEGGTTLEVRLDGAVVCEAVEPGAIAVGGCEIAIPAIGAHTVEIEVSNASGEATESRNVFVATGPTIVSFVATPAKLDVGATVTVRWAALADPAGELPALVLTDDAGEIQEILDGDAGQTTLVLDRAGEVELTLTATTSHPSSTPATATQTVRVYALPEATLVATPSVFDDSVESEAVLSWTSLHADSLELFETDEDGSNSTLIHVVPQAERASGSFGVAPQERTRYLLVATNGAGSSTFADAVVDVAPTAILSFDAAPAEIVAGEAVTFEWTTRTTREVRLDFVGTYMREETMEPLVDAEALGGTRLPLGTDCGNFVATYGCQVLQFPAGFAFPFAGTDRGAVRVYSNGFLSFDTATASGSTTFNDDFPTSASSAFVHLAPFWDGLGWDETRFPTGNIWYLHREDPVAGDSVVIHWKGIGFSGHRTADLNFEVVLWANGDFEYRYGTMAPGTATAALVSGSSATIGYQFPNFSSFDNINYNTTIRIRDRLEHRTFAYRVPPSPLPTSGSLVWHPYTNRDSIDVTLTATGATGTFTETRTIGVRRKPILDVVQTPPTEAEAGETFRIAWETQYATAVAIEDDDGTVLCSASEHGIDAGFCDLSDSNAGQRAYVVRASGAGGYSATRRFEVAIYEPFGIASFEAAPSPAELGQPVTLSWETFGDATVSLTADGVELLPAGQAGGAGSLAVPGLTADTTFVLRVTNSLGLIREKTVDVEVWKVSLEVSATPAEVRPGTPVQIDVTAGALDGGATPVVWGTFPMGEVTDPAAAFDDIRMKPGVAPVSLSSSTDNGSATFDLPAGFSFPFFGEERTSVRVYVDGWLSFDTPASVHQNVALPSDASDPIKGVHLAPFWDDLHRRTNGIVHAGMFDADTYAIQWSHMALYAGSSNTDQQDLNFQILLGRDGSFEYRYGAMSPQGNPSSSCYPNTCANEVAGSSATIGYQMPGGRSGYTLHFGGTTNSAANTPFPGGLGGRTFRYEPAVGQGSFTVTPSESQTLVFCTKSGAATVCKEIEVKAEFGVESFVADTESLGFGQSATLQWATKGGTQLVIRANGAVLQTITDPQIIDAGTLLVTPAVPTTYRLDLTAPGRSASATFDVDVERLSLTATGPVGISAPGAPVEISWNLTNADPDLTPVMLLPLAEATGRPFSEHDLEYDPDAVELVPANADNVSALLTFEEDFTFDYLGSRKTWVRVTTDGYLSFDSATTTSSGSNQLLPTATGVYKRVNLAPFWDDLHTRTNGRVLAKRLDADSYAIQWSRVSLTQGSTAQEEFDLNFMVVLHRDGSFEYRYGSMLPVPGGSSTCVDNDCLAEVNGSSATIGYQDESGTQGYLFHFGGNGRTAGQPTVVPELSNRTWVFHARSTSGTVQVTPTETTEYRLCVLEPDSGKVTCAEPVEVKVDWGILSFTATPEAFVAGEQVTVAWSVAGVEQLVLKANGSVMVSHGPGAVPATGTFVDQPLADTTYTLEIESLGRKRTETTVVRKRTFDLDVQLAAGRHFPGQTVTLSWQGQPHDGGSIPLTTPMGEVAASPGQPSAYQDVGAIGGVEHAVSGGNGHAVIQLPFSFPYFGQRMNQVQLYVDGYLTFDIDTSKTGVTANTDLPNSAANPSRVHLAPFWDDHFMRGHDSVWTFQPSPDEFVIQWKNFNRSAGSTANALYDLNFQVVLFADGSFEYRYGEMKAPPQPFSYSSCYPSTCELEANGSSATIGYQNVGGTMGSRIHYGGNSAAEVVPFVGGLAGRSFRFDAAPAGSTQVLVGAYARTDRICGEVDGFVECRDVLVRPVAEPGDFVVSELMIDPAGGPSA
ncbi:MAG TPA: hypothetical protein VGD74_11380, partial [Vulgatibacter sp.]